MILGHVIELNIETENQKDYLAQSFGVSRYAYNWAVSQKKEEYKNIYSPWKKKFEEAKAIDKLLMDKYQKLHKERYKKKFNPKTEEKDSVFWNLCLCSLSDEQKEQYNFLQLPKPILSSQFDLRKKFNIFKKNPKFSWIEKVSKYVPQQAIINLGKAYDNYFRKGLKNGFSIENLPKRKKKYKHDRFYIGNDAGKIYYDLNKKQYFLKLPLINEPFLLKEKPRFLEFDENGKIKADKEKNNTISSFVVKRENNKYYVSVAINVINLKFKAKPQSKNQTCGIDLGIKSFATMYNGKTFETIEGLKEYRKQKKRLRKYQKTLSRRKKKLYDSEGNLLYSQGYYRALNHLQRLHRDIKNKRKDLIHKLTTKLVKHYETIKIEDLDVVSMKKDRNIAKLLMDGAFFEFKRQLLYKGSLYGSTIILAHRYFASSKLCNCCSTKNKDLVLGQSNWTCNNCGENHNRDENAAINLFNYVAGSCS